MLAFANALREHDLVAMGEVMRASHESLRDDFGVTGAAPMPWLRRRGGAGVIGARMTGAGFGGCTVNLVQPDMVDAFADAVGRRYAGSTGRAATFHRVASADGAREMTP